MRKVLYLLYALMLALLFPAAIWVSQELPVDTGAYVSQKYSGWNGVLQAWVCCRWQPGGNFISWLNSRAAEFEKQHDGVYIEFTPVSAQTMSSMRASGIRLPELVFFSPGVLQNSDGLNPLGSAQLRSEFENPYALPVAMGGYIWVYNRALSNGAEIMFPMTALPDDGGRCFSAGMIALMSGASGATEPEAPGVDLGLPVNAAAEIIPREDALDLFIDGELPCLAVTQREIAALLRLRDAGRGPDWACAATGDLTAADQLLLAGAVDQTGENAAEREALAAEFAAFLLERESQASLASIGAFSVTGETVHGPFSVYADLDALINSRPLAAPDPFSEHSLSGAAAIVHEYCKGNYTARRAMEKLGWHTGLQKHSIQTLY